MHSVTLVNFTQLKVWQKGHGLALNVYRVTGMFPSKETFGLVSQMRRASISITSNIAEGFGRRNKNEKRQFYFVAKASAVELQNQLILSKDLVYINENEFNQLFDLTVQTLKLLNTLIRSLNPLNIKY